MSNLRLAYNSDDYTNIRVRVLYSITGGIRVYDFDNEQEADVQRAGVTGGYSTISGDEYTLIVHKGSINYING